MPLPALPAAAGHQREHLRNRATHRQQFHDRAGTDRGPGLAIRLPSGEWFSPPVIPGTFLINLGNMMRRWSNNRFLSTPHGVINKSGRDRYSIAYFHSPNPDVVIDCLPSCVSADNPAQYEPAVYRDLILAFFRANYFHQQGHKSEAAMVAAAQ